jgi:carboxypeptidase Q
MHRKNLLLAVGLSCALGVFGQSGDSLIIRHLFQSVLSEGTAYENLRKLCSEAPARLSGTANAAKAVELTKNLLLELKLDRVWLQEVMVPTWFRGTTETGSAIHGSARAVPLKICALGGSVGTPPEGITAEVLEVGDMSDLEKIGEKEINGKIIFFNREMDCTEINTFKSYGGCAGNRVFGAAEAAKFGAVAVLVRSLTLGNSDSPHTGVMVYRSEAKIPGAALSAKSADLLHNMLSQKGSVVKFHLTLDCRPGRETLSHNVIGEIRGSKYPDEIILVGGHLDSLDLSEGAHDDGAGVVQSIEVMYLFKKLGIRPERTIRCVLFMNEENGGRGAVRYAEEARVMNQKHVAAIESDRGGFTPRGFTVEGNDTAKNQCLAALKTWYPLLQPYLVNNENDNFVNVNKRELELGAGAIAALVFLLSKYGLSGSAN